VYLDARHLPDVAHRFPTITASCLAVGVDPQVDLIPVAPAAHYASGGVRTDLAGRTSIDGLYACGEVACTGVHGANRLASNSLLEGLVFARRIAADILRDLPAQADPVPARQPGGVARAEVRIPLQRAMSTGAGVLRSRASLADAAAALVGLGSGRVAPGLRSGATREGVALGAPGPRERSERRELGAPGDRANTASWEATNLLIVASALVVAAQRREETRGCHWREDFPTASPQWRGHLLAGLDPDGRLVETWEALP
jgi:L-aspartate oxidase